ncbi:MAG: hypothetical protein AYP45_07415 [Candidatus Brocadia carolinensis]|uniref:Uncharacterized protein n=1 Tax=Candidatus Brocadia carolinensis TaxID=1004156 RepID=A0A1V4AUM1_9BACT|nr:MAG: hypothetical protein AYP45_07415 [Candidatus Brocadia caroliniensis]
MFNIAPLANCFVKINGCKHPAPLVLADMYDNTMAAEQRYVYSITEQRYGYRKNKPTTPK